MEKWKRKRQMTLIGYILITAVNAIDSSVINATVYVYIKGHVKTDDPALIYGTVVAMFTLGALVFGLMTSRWVDRTRQVKLFINVTLVLQIIGNLLYVIYYSPIFLIAGRCLAGAGDAFANVSTGEITRNYRGKERMKALWRLGASYSYGYFSAPLLPLLFKGIDFHIGHLHVTYLNFIGIFMAGLLLLTLIISNILVHDIAIHPTESNSKKTLLKAEKGISDCDSSNIIADNESIAKLLKSFLQNSDILLLLLISMFVMYCADLIDIVVPMLVIDFLNLDVNVLMYIFFAQAGCYVIFMAVFPKVCTSDLKMYYGAIFCFLSQLISFGLLLLLYCIKRNLVQDLCILLMIVTASVLMWALEDVLMKHYVAAAVRSDVRSFAESFRYAAALTGSLVAFFTGPILFPWLKHIVIGLSFIVPIVILCFVSKRKKWTNLHQKIDSLELD